MIAVTRPVYASTTVTAVNLADSSSRAKDSNPQPCYPDICFAVDNFDNAFEDLVSSSSSNDCVRRSSCDCVRRNSMSNVRLTCTHSMPTLVNIPLVLAVCTTAQSWLCAPVPL